MKIDKKILLVFILNLSFSLFELMGGIYTKSVSIISDAIHDFGDALSIGLSYILEKISKRKPNNKYTYGYLRYSVIGAIITNTILIISSIFVIINGVKRILNPVEINYNGMIIFAIVGFVINLLAVYMTKEGDSLNQKAVNLHMLEDVLGWLCVLIGAFIIKITKFYTIDAILSIIVAGFILLNAIKSYKKIVDLFLEKTPDNIDIEELKNKLLNIKGVINIHHIHIWSLDGIINYATMHVITSEKNINKIKEEIRNKLKEYDINHITIELEKKDYECIEKECVIDKRKNNIHSQHKHH